MVDYCVCAEPIEERALYPCNHSLCLTCTLKKRVLMKDDSCPYCRAPGPRVAVVTSGESDPANARIDFKRWGIHAETPKLVTELSHILSFPCPQCDDEQKNYKKLKSHAQKDHSKMLCDVCTKHEFVFSNEYQTFDSAKAYHKHVDKEHIKCRYCNQHFYSATEFSKHCRQAHFGCEVCERRDPQHPRYFKTYEELAQHYTDKHYACMVPSCLDDKHIVFATQMELQSHMLEAHPGLIRNRRDFQQVDLAQLSISEADNLEKPAEEAKSSQSFDSRYMARLDIAANHDAEKIDQIRAANQTFMGKKVPVEILIATYENVLKDASKPQITALLATFNKAYASKLADDVQRRLTFVLRKRTEVEDETIAEERKTQRQALPSQKALGPAPTRVQKFGWGTTPDEPKLRGRGLDNALASLPQLGQGKNAKSSPALSSLNTYATAASHYKPLTRQIQGLNRLPKLPSKDSQSPPVGRQTSIPLRSSRSSYSPSSYTGWRPSTPQDHVAVSVSEAEPLVQPTSQSKPRLNNLPSLPNNKEGEQKKKKHNVLRIV